MVESLLIIFSMIATVVVFVAGIVLAVSPYGETWAGVALAVMAALLAVADVQLAREHWGLYRRRRVLREQLEHEPAVQGRPTPPQRPATRKPRRHASPASNPKAAPQRRRKRPTPEKTVAATSG